MSIVFHASSFKCIERKRKKIRKQRAQKQPPGPRGKIFTDEMLLSRPAAPTNICCLYACSQFLLLQDQYWTAAGTISLAGQRTQNSPQLDPTCRRRRRRATIKQTDARCCCCCCCCTMDENKSSIGEQNAKTNESNHCGRFHRNHRHSRQLQPTGLEKFNPNSDGTLKLHHHHHHHLH